MKSIYSKHPSANIYQQKVVIFIFKNIGVQLALLMFAFVICLTGSQNAEAQTYGSPLFVEDFGTVPSGTTVPANYRGEITGRGSIGAAYWFWPATCSGTGWLSQSTPTPELSVVRDTLTLSPRVSGVTNWYFDKVTELTSGTPYNTGYINNPANIWCLYEQKSVSSWSWKFSGPNTTCPSTSTTVRNVRSVRWYNINGLWKLGNWERDWYKYSVACSGWHAGMDDGGYALSSNPDYVHGQDAAWFSGPDHTGNTNGMMFVVNAAWQAGQFYKREITGLCYGAQFEFKSYYANILKSSSCGGSGLPVNIRYEVWDKDPGDNEANSSVVVGGTSTNGAKLLAQTNTGNVAATSTLIWNKTSLIFNVPQNQNGVYIVLRNNAAGGCGNDLAIDDISFSPYIPFTIGFDPITTDYCATGQINLKGKLTAGSIPLAIPYVFQWQQAVQGTTNWVNIGNPISNINNVNLVLNVGDIGNKTYRVISAASSQNFNNSNCYVASSSFDGNTVVIPTGSITAVADVCGTAGHTPVNATFTVNYQGNKYPWTYYYKINNGAEQSQIVNSPNNTNSKTIQITDITTIKLTKISTSDCDVLINSSKVIKYSIGNPEAPVQITGPNPACIGSGADFSVPEIQGAVIYTWAVSGDWQIISGQGTRYVRLKIGNTPISVHIKTVNACGTNNFISATFQTTNLPPDAPSIISTPDGFCIPNVITGNTDILFETSEVSGTQNYLWDWDSPLTIGTQLNGTGQYLKRIVLSVPNNISSFNVRVKTQNGCGFSANKEVAFIPAPITASASAGTITCYGGSTILTVSASGGTGSLQYSINGEDFQSSNTFNVNAAGSPYTATVKDANNCLATASVIITQPIDLRVSIITSYSRPDIDSVAVKGCNDATITFTLPKPALNDTTITYTIGGTAINGQDYMSLPNSILIPAGQNTNLITMMPYLIGLTPGDLTFSITLTTASCTVNTFIVKIKENL